MTCTVHELGELKKYKYVVTFARYNNKWIVCKHKNRSTWEASGGHIEQNETPLDAAKRELREETGALDFGIEPVCDYSAGGTNGQVFLANVSRLEKIPGGSEMERINLFDEFPRDLTYPEITEKLLPRIIVRMQTRELSNKSNMP